MIELWNTCGLISPQNDPHRDIQRKCRVNPELFLLAVENGQIIGSVMAGYDGHRGWLYYLAVDPDWRGRGFGSMMVDEARRRLRDMGCPKINILVRRTNAAVVDFYRKAGFTEPPDTFFEYRGIPHVRMFLELG